MPTRIRGGRIPFRLNPSTKVKKVYTDLLLIGSICASLLGIAVFLVLFIPDMNIYWIILSPVIIVCYQIPAVFLYWLYKKNRPSDPNGE